MTDFIVRLVNLDDKDWVSQLIKDQWGSEIIIVHGDVFYPADLPGFIAVLQDERVGLITYHIQGNECEIISLNSLSPSIGIGTRLIEDVKKLARNEGCCRVCVITTNDNLNALRFYQKRGFELVAVHRKAVEKSREIKPEIPTTGEDGIPIRDEIELEMILGRSG
jgi:GNAT superfamily N-acetyltransferase